MRTLPPSLTKTAILLKCIRAQTGGKGRKLEKNIEIDSEGPFYSLLLFPVSIIRSFFLCRSFVTNLCGILSLNGFKRRVGGVEGAGPGKGKTPKQQIRAKSNIFSFCSLSFLNLRPKQVVKDHPRFFSWSLKKKKVKFC